MYNWCYTWDHELDQYNLAAFIDENKVHKENWWSIYESKDELSEHTLPLRKEIEEHKDNGDNENAVVFFCPRGELTVTLHNAETKEVLATKVLNSKNAMCLYHTRFMHDIQGVGDLVVFGLSKEFDAEGYFACE